MLPIFTTPPKNRVRRFPTLNKTYKQNTTPCRSYSTVSTSIKQGSILTYIFLYSHHLVIIAKEITQHQHTEQPKG